MVWQLWQLSLVLMWPGGLPPPAAVWQVTQAVAPMLAWRKGPADSVPGQHPGPDGIGFPAGEVRPHRAARAGHGGGRDGRLTAVAVAGVGAWETRTAILSREEWQPEPPQSWPAWWLGLSRTHSRVPLLVCHFMPYSWQLMHFIEVTTECFMTVPAKLVKTAAE